MADDDANSNVLVERGWVAAHLDDPEVRLVESDVDDRLYETGHISGAVKLDWYADLQSRLTRDFVTREEFEALMAACGIANDMTVVFYGDRHNCYAAYTYWLFKLYGHRDCRIMDGGRTKWEAEGRAFTRETPPIPPSAYRAQPADLSIRAFRDQVLAHVYAGNPLVDARSPEEYAGQLVDPPEYPREDPQRAGHIPTAVNVPWLTATNADGTLKGAAELRAAYLERGIRPDQEVIAYGHAGECSAHTWFVLTQLLGYPTVRNYDGSWTEWGNLVRAPIEK